MSSRICIAVCAISLLSAYPVCAQGDKPAKAGVVATIKGAVITQEVLKQEAAQDLERAEITRLQNEANYTRVKHAALEAALSRIIEEKVLEAETAATGMSKEALLEKQLAGKVKEPTLEDLNAHYPPGHLPSVEERQKVFARMKPYLKTQNYNKAKAEYVAQLKKKYGVTESLEPLRLKVETAGSPSMGPDAAPVTLVEFTDFQCSTCASFESMMQNMVRKSGNQVRLVHRGFANAQNPQTEKAAEAALCAGEQGRFWDMNNLLFQTGHSELRDLIALAATLNLHSESFNSCLDSGRHAVAVKKDMYAAAGLGVTSTPALFVNGRPIQSPRTGDEIAKVIEEELYGASHLAKTSESNNSRSQSAQNTPGSRK